MHTRRTLSALAAVLGMIAAMVMFAGPAQSAVGPYTDDAAAIFVDTSNPPVAGTLTVTGINFGENDNVSLDLYSTVKRLKNVRADDDGSFSTRVKLPPKVCGAHRIVATGKPSGRTASTAIMIGSCTTVVNQGAVASQATKASNLPRTGAVALLGIGVVGLLLLGSGIVMKTTRRRNGAS